MKGERGLGQEEDLELVGAITGSNERMETMRDVKLGLRAWGVL